MRSPVRVEAGPGRRTIAGAALVTAVVTMAAVVALGGAVPAGAQAPPETVTAWLQVDGGPTHTCAVATTHALYCWGSDAFGALGHGGPVADANTPTQVAGPATDWAAVSAGNSVTCAIKVSGALFCWGSDSFGALGNGGTDQHVGTPTAVAGAAGPWRSVSAGGDGGEAAGGAVCAVNVAGHLFCWGMRALVGDGVGTHDRSVPTEVAGGASNWSSVSVGGTVACARKTTGRLFCWGGDFYGQVGDGPSTVDRKRPVPVANGDTGWASVSAGWAHTCAVRTTGRLFCWGLDEHGQIGRYPRHYFDFRTVPTEVRGATTDWTAVAAGGSHSCARKTSGRLYCWGVNWNGQLGHDLPTDETATPVRVSGGITDWAAIAAGGEHNCAVRAGAALYCWGWDGAGQVGDGGTDDQIVPAPVPISG